MTWNGAHRWALATVLVTGLMVAATVPAGAPVAAPPSVQPISQKLSMAALAAKQTPLVTQAATTAASSMAQTVSHYELDANAWRLYLQGKYAGKASAQGIVILDFGRPGFDGAQYGTVDFSDKFVSLADIKRAVEFYVMGYFRYAPANTTLYVAIGTNNSCGAGQPCGEGMCGCTQEPPDYVAWGAQLAEAVEAVGDWAAGVKTQFGYTDVVRVVAADDAEPAYDPAYTNTYDLLEGYAQAVGGSAPAMVDYGSAEAQYWTEDQLFQVADGFAPDVAMPEIYYGDDADDWATLLRYAHDKLGRVMSIYGVLVGGPGTDSAQAAYLDMLSAAEGITHQTSIPWVSTIRPQQPVLAGIGAPGAPATASG